MSRITLRDLEILCDAMIPIVARHPASLQVREHTYWHAHEIGHFLTVPPTNLQVPYFGLTGDVSTYECTLEIAAVLVSGDLLSACGALDLSDLEHEHTGLAVWQAANTPIARMIANNAHARRVHTARDLERLLQRSLRRHFKEQHASKAPQEISRQ